ncbi:MAG TPA: adenylate/guanylate cyclase domain-containing protein [Actinomycetota bacterium]|nr:adenylate/guanylate cyclase domain-containing protein [Actinomycetota bacterium]
MLFTDIVGSTERAVELGDHGWRELLRAHHAFVRQELKRFGGREIDTAGDGFFAIFAEPGEAVRCAAAVVAGVRSLGIEVRAGLHMGEVEVMGSKVGGVAVHVASRVMAQAGPGEVLVSSTIRDLVAGAGFEFEERGVHSLKGIPGEWGLFAPKVEPGARGPRMARAGGSRRAPWIVAVAGVAGLGAVLLFLLLRSGPSAPPRAPAQPVAALVVINPSTNRLAYRVPVDRPWDVAVSGQFVWVGTYRGNYELVKVSTQTHQVVATIPRAGFAVAADPYGVWTGYSPAGFLASAAQVAANKPFLYRIDGATNRPDRELRIEAPPEVTSMALYRGFLWIYNPVGSDLLKIDPDHQKVEDSIPIGFNSAGVDAIAVGEGRVRVVDRYGGVIPIDPRTDRQEDEVAVPGAVAVAAGEGAIWVSTKDGHVVELDPDTRKPRGSIDVGDGLGSCRGFSGAGQLGAIAVGEGGVWVVDDGTGAVVRVDASTRNVAARVHIGGCPWGIAAGAGSVWVAAATSSGP